MRKVFWYGIAVVALLAGCAHRDGASVASGVQSQAAPKGDATDIPPGMMTFPGVQVPDVPGWIVRGVGPLPLAVAQTMLEPECKAFMVMMSRPGSPGDARMMDAIYRASETLPPKDGVATLREVLPDGFIVNRLLPDGRRACVSYRLIGDAQGRVLVRTAARWSAKCGDAPTDAFLHVVRGLRKN